MVATLVKLPNKQLNTNEMKNNVITKKEIVELAYAIYSKGWVRGYDCNNAYDKACGEVIVTEHGLQIALNELLQENRCSLFEWICEHAEFNETFETQKERIACFVLEREIEKKLPLDIVKSNPHASVVISYDTDNKGVVLGC